VSWTRSRAPELYEQARVSQIDGEAKRLFGVGRVEPFAPFRWRVDAWQRARPNSSTGWMDELAEQVRVASQWHNPRFRWQLMTSVDESDRAMLCTDSQSGPERSP
jgi:hypothetical protein